MQTIANFEHGGGLASLFEAWSPEEYERAKRQLADQIAQLERIARLLTVGQVNAPGTHGLRVLHGEDEVLSERSRHAQ